MDLYGQLNLWTIFRKLSQEHAHDVFFKFGRTSKPRLHDNDRYRNLAKTIHGSTCIHGDKTIMILCKSSVTRGSLFKPLRGHDEREVFNFSKMGVFFNIVKTQKDQEPCT